MTLSPADGILANDRRLWLCCRPGGEEPRRHLRGGGGSLQRARTSSLTSLVATNTSFLLLWHRPGGEGSFRHLRGGGGGLQQARAGAVRGHQHAAVGLHLHGLISDFGLETGLEIPSLKSQSMESMGHQCPYGSQAVSPVRRPTKTRRRRAWDENGMNTWNSHLPCAAAYSGSRDFGTLEGYLHQSLPQRDQGSCSESTAFD